MKPLTPQMINTLRLVGSGVRLYRDGHYYSIDDRQKVDGRSLQALYNRGLVAWRGYGGATYQIHIRLTEAGQACLDEMDATPGGAE